MEYSGIHVMSWVEISKKIPELLFQYFKILADEKQCELVVSF